MSEQMQNENQLLKLEGDPTPDELCDHVALGAPSVGGFVFSNGIAVGMCGDCIAWCTANFDNPLTFPEWQAASKAGICQKHCSVCEGMNHHWMPECNDTGEPMMVCKHCPAVREYTDGDGDL